MNRTVNNTYKYCYWLEFLAVHNSYMRLTLRVAWRRVLIKGQISLEKTLHTELFISQFVFSIGKHLSVPVFIQCRMSILEDKKQQQNSPFLICFAFMFVKLNSCKMLRSKNNVLFLHHNDNNKARSVVWLRKPQIKYE